MSKRTITIFLTIVCFAIILIMTFYFGGGTSDTIIFKKPQINTVVNKNYANNNKKTLVKQIKYDPSRIVINHNYKDIHRIMAKDVYSDKEIKKLVDFINSIEYEEQIKNKSEVEEWDFLIHIYDGSNMAVESVTFYENSDKYAFQNDIAGIRVTKDIFEKFEDLYCSLEGAEVHCSDIK